MELEELKYRIKHLYWGACHRTSGVRSFLDRDHRFLLELGARLILGTPKGTRKGFTVVRTGLMGDIEAHRKGIRVRKTGRVEDMGGYPIFLEFPTKRAERMILLGWPA